MREHRALTRADAETPRRGVTTSAIRRGLPARVRDRSYAWALVLGAVPLALYLAASWVAYTAAAVPVLVAAAVARGLLIGTCFIVGHDACHNALAPSARLNHWIGQINFLPAWHVFTVWKVHHNHIHHRHTNVLERDNGYPPWSRQAYDAAGWFRRLHYRVARTPLGAGLLYWPETREHLLPSRRFLATYRSCGPWYLLEAMCVWAWIVVELLIYSGGLGAAGIIAVSPAGAGWSLAGLGVTHATWNWLMGFTTFLHHTHPDVPWSSEADAIEIGERQLSSTVHVDLGMAHGGMLNIFVHTAHHVDPSIPLYRLPLAQSVLQQQFGSQVTTWPFSLSGALRCFRDCKLWNPASRRWERFEHESSGSS